MKNLKIVSVMAVSFLLAGCAQTAVPVTTSGEVSGSGSAVTSASGSASASASASAQSSAVVETKSTAEAIGETSYVQMKNFKKDLGSGVIVYAPEDGVTTSKTEGCSKGYVTGSFKMSLVDEAGYLVGDVVDLGKIEIAPYPEGIHVDGIDVGNIGGSGQVPPFVMVETYGSCNGNLFSFYTLNKEQNKIVPVKFNDDENGSNQKFAMFKDISFDTNSVKIKSYDNSTQKWKTVMYDWNAGTNTFLITKG